MNANLYSYFSFNTKAENILFHLDDGTLLNYNSIDKKVAQYCHVFEDIGLKQGDRIAQQTDKCVDAFCVYLASLRYGTIYIPLNPAFQLEELAYFIEDAVPTLFVCSPDRVGEIQQIANQKNISLIIESLSDSGTGSIQSKVKNAKEIYSIALKSKKDIACILYTSGTTGRPKGAMLSHENLLSNGLTLKTCWGFTEKDTLLHMLPIFHCHGLFFASHCVLLSGSSMIFLPKLDIDLAIKHLPNSSVLMGIPTYYTRLLSDFRFTKDLVSAMRLFISGSAPLLEKTFYEFEKKIGQRIVERYGMTETGINTSNPLDGDRIPGSVGIPLPAEELRIVNDNDVELPINESGHIQVRGNNIFLGYWKKTDETTKAFTSDGFFRTGDIGKCNERGYVSITGRAKDMIITGGINVSPKEIELLIDEIDGIKESAVIGLPHADFGEAVTAIIVLKENIKLDKNSIISEIKPKLASYKIPKEVIFIEYLPRNAMGKVQKSQLREIYNKLYL